jgi:hypothetical protein
MRLVTGETECFDSSAESKLEDYGEVCAVRCVLCVSSLSLALQYPVIPQILLVAGVVDIDLFSDVHAPVLAITRPPTPPPLPLCHPSSSFSPIFSISPSSPFSLFPSIPLFPSLPHPLPLQVLRTGSIYGFEHIVLPSKIGFKNIMVRASKESRNELLSGMTTLTALHCTAFYCVALLYSPAK